MWTVFMPSLPKVGWISGQEWARKIKRKLKAQQLCATASDVSVAGEIKKDLHEECETSRLRRDQARVCCRTIEIFIGHNRESIGEHHLRLHRTSQAACGDIC
jgi:hypothetical protein